MKKISNFMKKIKGVYYGTNKDLRCILLLSVFAIVFRLVNIVELSVWSMFCAACLYVNYKHNIKKIQVNKDLSYLLCTKSLLHPKSIWVNQKVKKDRDQDKCPREEFKRELEIVLDSISEETIYCCTHTAVINIIKRHEIKLDRVSECHTSDLLKIKKKIRNDRCKKCEKRGNCEIFRSEITKYYNVKFKK